MNECPRCGEISVQEIRTEYGVKEVCRECRFVVKDVDAYAGIMVWAHKTAPELEIHANRQSMELVTGATRHSNPHGNPRVVQHVGEMATRRGTNARAQKAKIDSARSYPKPHVQVEDRVRDLLRTARIPMLRLLPGRVAGSKSVTQIFTGHLHEIEPILLGVSETTRSELLNSVVEVLGCSRTQGWWLLASRRVIKPPRRGKNVRILSVEGKHYTADLSRMG